MGLEGKVAIVTGGGRGIGRAIALRLADDGADIAVNDLDASAAEQVVEEVRRRGRKGVALVADVSDRDAVFDLVERTGEALGRLDIMVANAGIAIVKPFLEHTPQDLERSFAINASGVFYCMQAAAERFIAQGGGGKIISASSIAGHQGFPHHGAYSGSKHAIVGFTQVAAKELGSHGITVNAYCPGVVDTDMWDVVSKGLGQSKAEAFASLEDTIALGRVQTPEDVAGFVSFLASSDGDYITGQSVNVDGGMLFQ